MSENPKLLDSWIAAAIDIPITATSKRLLRKVKYAIGILAMVLVVSLIFWPLLYPIDQPMKLSFSGVETNVAEPSKMLQPRFHGLDKENRPYSIKAAEAEQIAENVIRLTEMSGDITLTDRWVLLKADEGLIHITDKQLDLKGGVNIFSSDGYEITTEAASFNLNASKGSGDVPLECQGPIGLLTAKGFSLDVPSETLLFKGRVNVRIYPPHSRKN